MSIPEFPNLTEDERKANSFAHHVLANAQGVPLELSAAPTTTGNELARHGMWGKNGNFIYINLFGTTYKVGITAV